MSWRRQNVLSLVAILLLVALNTVLPASDGASGPARAVIASNHR